MPDIMLALCVRLLLVSLFLFSALDKILNPKAAITQAAEIFPKTLAPVFLSCGFVIEIAGSLAILTSTADMIAAYVLALYCIATALLWKQFWRVPDFRLRGKSQGREVFWDFLKNLGLAGGFFLLAHGSADFHRGGM